MSEAQNRDPSLAAESDSSQNQITRQRKWVPFSEIEHLQVSLAMNDAEISRALFQSDGTFRGWKASGKFPAWVPLALERLIDKLGAAVNGAPCIFVVRVPASKRETFCDVASALGARITRVE